MRFMLVPIMVLSLVCPCIAEESIGQILETWRAGHSPRVLGERIINRNLIEELYEKNNFSYIWSHNDRITALGLELLQQISHINEEGLLPEDYHLKPLQLHDTQTPSPTFSEIDLLLTDSFITLANHLRSGKVNPESLTPEWKSKNKNIDASLLLQLAQEQGIEKAFDKVRPNQPKYLRLKQLLDKLNHNLPSEWPILATSPAIKAGTTDTRLPLIRDKLVYWGDLASNSPELLYDVDTEVALKKFQKRHGLDADGVIGQSTMNALNFSPQQRVQQIIVNLERWRWLDEDFGKLFVVVNIAAFDLRVYKNSKKVMQFPVIVGKNYRKTPVFSDRIKYIVINPTWTVPPKLAVQDKLAEIHKDPNYLMRMGIKVYDRNSNLALDPTAIDWSQYSKKNFPFRLVQSAGPLNALGQIKFIFPNAYDVYLHDTPTRDLFAKSERAFSSGCIRLSAPIDLAELLLTDTQWNRDKIITTIDSGLTQTIYLPESVPVHIEYWTAWQDSSNTIQFRPDIYQRDKALYSALTTPLNLIDVN